MDLKTGVHQRETTPAQRRQLLLYAGLVQSVLGRLPDDCVIKDVRGRETTFSVAQAEVDAVLCEADAARDAFNISLISAQGAPALPSAENCRWCDFRIVCSGYWRARQPDWPSTGGDMVGTVTGTSSSYAEIQTLDYGETHRLLLGSDEEQPSLGDLVLTVNSERAGYQTSKPRWNSHVRIIRSES